jgi:F0F1-type ATP synthase membrane subunit b/b'
MDSTVLLTIAKGGEHPLIDMDWTIGIQLLIFGITFFAAKSLLFGPYLKLRADRFAGIEGARQDAANLSAEADAKLADYELTLEKARKRAQDERHKLRAEAAKHHGEVTGKAREQAVKAMSDATEKVQKESSAARSELLPKADKLGVEIAAKLLGREVA